MNVHLLYPDRDFVPHKDRLRDASELKQDLEIDTLLRAMAAGDAFLLEVANSVVLSSLDDIEFIRYRQQILTDCNEQRGIVTQLYGVAVDAIERERKIWGWSSLSRYPEGTLHRAVEVLKIFVEVFRKLRALADQSASPFRSEGFVALWAMLRAELNDEYLKTIEDHLHQLEFRDGVVMSLELGPENKGANHILRKPLETERSWKDRLHGWMAPWTNQSDLYAFELDDRDESGFQALSALRGYGIARIAAALAESTDHILSFFKALRMELGFYIGCLNLHAELRKKDCPVCFPEIAHPEEPLLSARGLYDASLALTTTGNVVRNHISADGKTLVMITGANRGGKSTFLRSIGLAQVMMQCGMFVPAEWFRASICTGMFTHFKREEDATMNSGKLDEELARMSAIVDRVSPRSVLLFNESFASTNEREGSEIARQVVRSLLDSGIRVFYVTHLFDLAESLYKLHLDTSLFLQAERLPDGQRTFRMIEGRPSPTSFGQDLYLRIFEDGSALMLSGKETESESGS